MRPSVVRWLALRLTLALALAGCTFPAPGTPVAVSSGLRVWLDQPPDGASLPLGVLTLRAHARGAGGSGVETVTFLVSSGGPPVTVGSVTTDLTQPLVTAEFDWNPSAPGEYEVQAQAFDRNGYVFSAPARLCVGLERTADGACAEAGPNAGFKLQGLVATDRNADGDAADSGEGPLAGVRVTLSGCDSQSVLTNPASSDPAFPEGVFAFGVASLGGCSIEVALSGWAFESFEGSPAYAVPWPADEVAHTILMRPAGSDTATATGTPTKPAQGAPTATATKTGQPTPTMTATKKPPGQPSASPTNTPQPSATLEPTETATTTPLPSDTPKPTDTQPPADSAPPAIDKVYAAPNPTFYGDSCTKDQSQFTAGATVTDPSGVASVTLFYRYGAGGSAGPWQTAGMSPVGGDQYTASVVNDSTAVYAQLGGADGYVEYYVQAQDTAGNIGQSPSPVIAIQYCIG